MTEEVSRRGKITIAPEVLLTIAKLSALGVPGVMRMSAVPGGVNRLFRRGVGDGVRIEVAPDDHAVTIDLYLVASATASVQEVSRSVQAEVARAIHDMVGMEVQAVNVHVEDVAYAEGGAP
jgi:uncharacterized alkaline shock family protein YloU